MYSDLIVEKPKIPELRWNSQLVKFDLSGEQTSDEL